MALLTLPIFAGLVWWLGLVWSGLVWFGLVWFGGLVWKLAVPSPFQVPTPPIQTTNEGIPETRTS